MKDYTWRDYVSTLCFAGVLTFILLALSHSL
jgi:hypothetical protein